tara:strand:- start:2053 stop:2907 length:855 start_codon:yes stop_codon:yes gene_type:complete
MIDFSLGIDAKRCPTDSGRFYEPVDEFLRHQYNNSLKPSWTNVASCESSPGLSEWKLIHGYYSRVIGTASATIGTVTHDAIDLMNQWKMKGLKDKKYRITTNWILNELELKDDIRWKMEYPSKWMAVERIKKQIMGYQSWYKENKPKLLQSEIMMWHPDVPYAGTADLVLELEYRKRPMLMLADLKTGNEQEKHFEQCMAYAILLEKIYNCKVGALGVLYSNGNWRDVPKSKMKVKVMRNKDESLTEDATRLAKRVKIICDLWKSQQKSLQPKRKLQLPNEFSL